MSVAMLGWISIQGDQPTDYEDVRSPEPRERAEAELRFWRSQDAYSHQSSAQSRNVSFDDVVSLIQVRDN